METKENKNEHKYGPMLKAFGDFLKTRLSGDSEKNSAEIGAKIPEVFKTITELMEKPSALDLVTMSTVAVIVKSAILIREQANLDTAEREAIQKAFLAMQDLYAFHAEKLESTEKTSVIALINANKTR